MKIMLLWIRPNTVYLRGFKELVGSAPLTFSSFSCHAERSEASRI
jgi:hypothetical protein